jgi:hypothetical protein
MSPLIPAPSRGVRVLLFGMALSACSMGGGGSMRSVIESPAPVTAPPRFVPLDSTKVIAPADTLIGDGCLSPLADPVTGIQIILIRSESGLGDYLAPSGSYGIKDGQLIRLDCNTGKALGIVRR